MNAKEREIAALHAEIKIHKTSVSVLNERLEVVKGALDKAIKEIDELIKQLKDE